MIQLPLTSKDDRSRTDGKGDHDIRMGMSLLRHVSHHEKSSFFIASTTRLTPRAYERLRAGAMMARMG